MLCNMMMGPMFKSFESMQSETSIVSITYTTYVCSFKIKKQYWYLLVKTAKYEEIHFGMICNIVVEQNAQMLQTHLNYSVDRL